MRNNIFVVIFFIMAVPSQLFSQKIEDKDILKTNKSVSTKDEVGVVENKLKGTKSFLIDHGKCSYELTIHTRGEMRNVFERDQHCNLDFKTESELIARIIEDISFNFQDIYQLEWGYISSHKAFVLGLASAAEKHAVWNSRIGKPKGYSLRVKKAVEQIANDSGILSPLQKSLEKIGYTAKFVLSESVKTAQANRHKTLRGVEGLTPTSILPVNFYATIEIFPSKPPKKNLDSKKVNQ